MKRDVEKLENMLVDCASTLIKLGPIRDRNTEDHMLSFLHFMPYRGCHVDAPVMMQRQGTRIQAVQKNVEEPRVPYTGSDVGMHAAMQRQEREALAGDFSGAVSTKSTAPTKPLALPAPGAETI